MKIKRWSKRQACFAGLMMVTEERVGNHAVFQLLTGEWVMKRIGDLWPCGHSKTKIKILMMVKQCESKPERRHPPKKRRGLFIRRRFRGK